MSGGLSSGRANPHNLTAPVDPGLEDTQVSGEMSHDAAADTSLAPLPGRARHTHSGEVGG